MNPHKNFDHNKQCSKRIEKDQSHRIMKFGLCVFLSAVVNPHTLFHHDTWHNMWPARVSHLLFLCWSSHWHTQVLLVWFVSPHHYFFFTIIKSVTSILFSETFSRSDHHSFPNDWWSFWLSHLHLKTWMWVNGKENKVSVSNLSTKSENIKFKV